MKAEDLVFFHIDNTLTFIHLISSLFFSMVEMNDAVDDSDDDADYTKMDMVWPFIILMGIKRAHILFSRVNLLCKQKGNSLIHVIKC